MSLLSIMVYHIYFRALLLAFLLLASGLLLARYVKSPAITRRNSDLIFLIMAVLTFAIRSFYFREMELDIDTSTWLSSVIAFKHYPDKLWILMNYTDARPLTVFPLIVGHSLGLPINYVSSELIGLLLWLGAAFLLYRTCLLIADGTVSLAVTGSLCVYLATISGDLAAYNSEHISIPMIMLAVFGLVSYIYHKWSSGTIALATGILLGSLVYAKFQNVPMGMVIGIFLVIVMMQRKDWRNAGLLVAGSLLPTVLVNCYYGYLGRLPVFWNSYFWNYFYYSYTTQFSSMPIAERFSIGRILHYLFYSATSGIYFVVFGMVILAGLGLNYKTLVKAGRPKLQLLVFAGLFLLSSLYAVLQSGNNFQHYKLYLLMPLMILSAMLIFTSQDKHRKYLIVFLVLGSLVQTGVNIRHLVPTYKDENLAALDQKVIESINRNTLKSDPIIVWGWRDGLHVRTLRAMGYRTVHPFHFSLKSPLIPYWTKDFLEDMESNKPALFIEAMIPEYSERGNIFLSHDKVPVVKAYVRKHYVLAEKFGRILVFKRKEGR